MNCTAFMKVERVPSHGVHEEQDPIFFVPLKQSGSKLLALVSDGPTSRTKNQPQSPGPGLTCSQSPQPVDNFKAGDI